MHHDCAELLFVVVMLSGSSFPDLTMALFLSLASQMIHTLTEPVFFVHETDSWFETGSVNAFFCFPSPFVVCLSFSVCYLCVQTETEN